MTALSFAHDNRDENCWRQAFSCWLRFRSLPTIGHTTRRKLQTWGQTLVALPSEMWTMMALQTFSYLCTMQRKLLTTPSPLTPKKQLRFSFEPDDVWPTTFRSESYTEPNLFFWSMSSSSSEASKSDHDGRRKISIRSGQHSCWNGSWVCFKTGD